MKRNIQEYLTNWKSSKRRKPLLLRGARQVGKTWSTRELSKSYKYFCEVNFEETPEVRQLFLGNLSPGPVIEKLSAYYGIPILPGETLLFLDEIQSCEQAIKMLRFFYEKAPEIHIIAAGSLLEFALEEIPSFGVGRIESLYMYPLSFAEFMTALGEEKLLAFAETANEANPLDKPFFEKFTDYYRTYNIIGGFPEVVADYQENHDLNACLQILDTLISNFEDDFGKYRTRIPKLRLQEVFRSIPLQAGAKFKYSNVTRDLLNVQIKEALELLIKAGLAYKVFHTSGQGLPLGAGINMKRFKIIPCDVGFYQRLSGLLIKDILVADYSALINKGAAAEVFTGTELMAYSSPRRQNDLYYWHREAKNSNAEIDYLFTFNGEIMPLEVKSGTRGSMKSLKMFLETHNIPFGYRISLENFGSYENIKAIPIFCLWRFREKL